MPSNKRVYMEFKPTQKIKSCLKFFDNHFFHASGINTPSSLLLSRSRSFPSIMATSFVPISISGKQSTFYLIFFYCLFVWLAIKLGIRKKIKLNVIHLLYHRQHDWLLLLFGSVILKFIFCLYILLQINIWLILFISSLYRIFLLIFVIITNFIQFV